MLALIMSFFFFFNDTAPTEIYTLSLHDALPIASLPNDVRRPTPRSYTRHFGPPYVPNRSETAERPDVARSPPCAISSFPPSAGRVCAGVLTREARLCGGPSSLVRNADASCAFAPRRVASSGTAKKAAERRAARAARMKAIFRRGNTATLSASAERSLGRRSGKLAMLFSFARQERASPLLRIGFGGAIPEEWRAQVARRARKIPLQGEVACAPRRGRRQSRAAPSDHHQAQLELDGRGGRTSSRAFPGRSSPRRRPSAQRRAPYGRRLGGRRSPGRRRSSTQSRCRVSFPARRSAPNRTPRSRRRPRPRSTGPRRRPRPSPGRGRRPVARTGRG